MVFQSLKKNSTWCITYKRVKRHIQSSLKEIGISSYPPLVNQHCVVRALYCKNPDFDRIDLSGTPCMT